MSREIKLAVKCPACRHTRLQSLRQIKSQAEFTCHECGFQAALMAPAGLRASPAKSTQVARKNAAFADAI